MEELTQQQRTQKSISAAFDSVNLINDLKQKQSLDEQQQDRLDRNQQHLSIMLDKDWFEQALTAEQKQQIQSAIQ